MANFILVSLAGCMAMGALMALNPEGLMARAAFVVAAVLGFPIWGTALLLYVLWSNASQDVIERYRLWRAFKRKG
jgi:hypothetical protein